MRLTENQTKAIYTLNKNILLNAGAGTGKTEVLTRRFVEMIRSGISLENIVCITFTKKAAKEMQERIREFLLEEGFVEELDHFYLSNISTIDSFCQKIVSEYARFCEINPSFSVLEEREEKELLEEVLRNEIRKHPEILKDFYEDLGFFTEEEIFKEILFFLLSKKDLLDLPKIQEKNEEIFKSFSEKRIHNKLKDELLKIAMVLETNNRSALAKFLKGEHVEILKIPGLLPEDYLNELSQFNFSLAPLKKEHLDLKIPNLLEELDLAIDIKNIEIYHRFFAFLEAVLKEYQRKKEEKGVLDFSDLSKYTYSLLENSEVKKELTKKYTHFLIDEYQDCSTIQKNLFFEFCSNHSPLDKENFFAVGDPKQSIYAFRGARAHIFTETIESVLESNGKVIFLEDNFRSTTEILNPINRIFQEVMGERYDAQKAHKSLEESQFFVSRNSDSPETIQAVDFIKGKYNEKQKFGDFTYLFRNRNSLADYQEILKEEDIPHYIVNSQGFYLDPFISDLVSFMIYCIFSEKKYLISILKGVFYNLSDEDLYDIFVFKNVEILEEIESQREKYLEIFNQSIYKGLSELILEYEILEQANFYLKDFQSQANLYKLLLMAITFDLSKNSFYDFVLKILERDLEEEHMQLEDENSDIVKLMTIHQSKGLSLDSVIIPRLNQRTRPNQNKINFHEDLGLSLPLENSGLEKLVRNKIATEEEEQMENLYYVAMTRAKENLFLGLDGYNSGFKGKAKDILASEIEDGNLIEFPDVDIPFKKEDRKIRPIKKILDFSEDFKRKKRTHYNIQMVSEFYDNQEKYISNYLNFFRDKEEKTSPSIIGQFVHTFAEIYENSLEEAFEKSLEYFPLKEEDFLEVKRYCENFIKLNPQKNNVLKEIPFHLLYEDHLFSGVIDRLEFSKKNIKLIDFKISNIGDNIVDYYRLQLLFYAYAVKKNYPDYEITLALQNLKNKKEYMIDYDENFLHSRMARFIEFTSELE